MEAQETRHPSVEQFSVKTLEIGGLGAALQALRLPYGKETRSDCLFYYRNPSSTNPNDDRSLIAYGERIWLCPKDSLLLTALVKRGDEHAKVLRGVMVWCEINAPRYWHVELDTYRVGAERLSSESTMHIQGRAMEEDSLVEMKENLTEGTMQKRVWMFSYQTLRRIYFQRRNHRLPQWRKFCEWIETLPFAKEFITIENGGDNSNE